MASEKQIAANRRNGAKGGPKTPRGKAHARMNRLSHGLRAELVVIPGEDPKEFEALRLNLEEYYQPVGPVEEDLVEQIVECVWRRRRAILFETGIIHRERYECEQEWACDVMLRNSSDEYLQRLASARSRTSHVPEDDDETDDDPAKLRAYEEAKEARDAANEELRKELVKFAVVFQRSAEDLDKLARYDSRNDRQLRNARQDLERAQDRRKSAAAEMAMVIEGTAAEQNEGPQTGLHRETREAATIIELQDVDQTESARARPGSEALEPEAKSEGSEAPKGNKNAEKGEVKLLRLRQRLAARKQTKVKELA